MRIDDLDYTEIKEICSMFGYSKTTLKKYIKESKVETLDMGRNLWILNKDIKDITRYIKVLTDTSKKKASDRIKEYHKKKKK